MLRLSCDREDPLTEVVVTKIVELAKAGERDPEILCNKVLAELGTPIQGHRLRRVHQTSRRQRPNSAAGPRVGGLAVANIPPSRGAPPGACSVKAQSTSPRLVGAPRLSPMLACDLAHMGADRSHVADVVGRDAPLHEIGAVGDERFDNHRLARIKRDFKREMVRYYGRCSLTLAPHYPIRVYGRLQGRGPRGAGSMFMAAWACPPHREIAWIGGVYPREAGLVRPLRTGGVRQRSARSRIQQARSGVMSQIGALSPVWCEAKRGMVLHKVRPSMALLSQPVSRLCRRK